MSAACRRSSEPGQRLSPLPQHRTAALLSAGPARPGPSCAARPGPQRGADRGPAPGSKPWALLVWKDAGEVPTSATSALSHTAPPASPLGDVAFHARGGMSHLPLCDRPVETRGIYFVHNRRLGTGWGEGSSSPQGRGAAGPGRERFRVAVTRGCHGAHSEAAPCPPWPRRRLHGSWVPGPSVSGRSIAFMT